MTILTKIPEADQHALTTPSSARFLAAQPRRTTTRIPPAAFAALIAMYGLLVSSFAVAFRSDGETLFQIAICVFYGIMYFGTPFVLFSLGRNRDDDNKESDLLSADPGALIETYTGPLAQRDALAQILSVPIALGFGAVAMALIIMNARP
jgi:hypothetical protein